MLVVSKQHVIILNEKKERSSSSSLIPPSSSALPLFHIFIHSLEMKEKDDDGRIRIRAISLGRSAYSKMDITIFYRPVSLIYLVSLHWRVYKPSIDSNYRTYLNEIKASVTTYREKVIPLQMRGYIELNASGICAI